MTTSTDTNSASNTNNAPAATSASDAGTSRELKKGSLAALKGLLPFLTPYRKQFFLAGIALVVAAASTLAIPAAFKQMIDLGFGGAAGSKSIQHVDLVFLALFGVASILALATAARSETTVASSCFTRAAWVSTVWPAMESWAFRVR